MACNCVRDNEKLVAEHYTKQLGVPATAKIKNIAWGIGGNNDVTEAAYLPYLVKADKPGFRGAKGKEISMFFSFCPFCGVSLKEAEKAA
jgi:hypothetical protein